MKFYKVLVDVPFTTSKTELDIKYKNLIYELPHELPKNSNEVQRSSWRHSLLSSLPCRNKYLIQALEKNTNTDNIISFLVLSKFTCFYDFSQITSKWFVFRKKHYNLYLTLVSFEFQYFDIFCKFQIFSKLSQQIYSTWIVIFRSKVYFRKLSASIVDNVFNKLFLPESK